MPNPKRLIPVLLFLLILPVLAAPEPAPDVAEAVALYDAGKYAEARVLFERLDATGNANGPLLYRLAFTLRRTGDTAAAGEMAQRAFEILETEFDEGGDLETAFYLSNAYRNRQQPEKSKQVALMVTDSLKSGTRPHPVSALDQFRVGKMYADQDKATEAIEWYGKALAGFEKDSSFPSYQEWIRRYEYDLAWEQGDWARAGELLEIRLAGGEGERADYDRLAVLQGRSGAWELAIETWRKVELFNPADGDRARYGRHLATRALEVAELPGETLDGEPIPGLDKERMEEVLTELATRAKQARNDGETILADGDPGDETTRKQIAAQQDELNRLKAVFVAVALEYMHRGHSIRQVAFFGGYAPMIFHADRWKIPGSGASR
jgi:tetratricopeptide (TPR) repeat protein